MCVWGGGGGGGGGGVIHEYTVYVYTNYAIMGFPFPC